MSKEPAERFESCSEFAAALGGKKIKTAKVLKKNGFPKLAAGLIFAVLLIGGGMRYYLFSSSLAKPPVSSPVKSPVDSPKPETPAPQQQPKTSQGNVREIAVLLQETYRLQARVWGKKKDIESANYDRGQTFGEYLDALKENFASGELAMKNNDVTSANASFKAAEKAADWIIANAHLRIAVQNLRREVIEHKSEANKFNASKLSSVVYSEAEKKVVNADKDYESGNFDSSLQTLKSALADYQKAHTEARKLTLENLISSAERAKKNRQWDKVQDFALKIHPWDPAKAKELTEFADKQIKQEKLLASARHAQKDEKWQVVYGFAVAALKIDNTNDEAKTLKTTAQEELRKIAVEKELSAARKAKAEKNWQSVHYYAVAALKIDNTNTEAQALKTTAQEELKKITVERELIKAREAKASEDWYDVIHYADAAMKIDITNAEAQELKTAARDKVIKTFNLPNGVKLEMVKVEPGSLPKDKYNDEMTLKKEFYIGKYEVTQAQWRAIMGTSLRQERDERGNGWRLAGEGDNYPMYYISLALVKEFLRKMNQDAPPGWQFALPTVTQWKFAARGGKKSRGYKYSGSDNLGNVAWHGCNSTHEVGGKAPNELGLYDMDGNVCEWCLAKVSKFNTTGVVALGYSWAHSPEWWLSIYPYGFGDSLGFRLALVQAE